MRLPALHAGQAVNEKLVALGIAAQLEARGWALWYEVDYPANKHERADIVGEKHSQLLVVEVKKTMSSRLLWQSSRWKFYAHFVCAGYGGAITPGAERLQEGAAAAGIGVWHAGAGLLLDPVQQSAAGEKKLRANLKEGNRCMEPGAAGGARVTALSETTARLVFEVRRQPGRDIETVLHSITHHWDSEREALKKLAWLLCHNKVPQVVARKFGNTLILYPR